jgi:hypothetical protein
MPLRNLLDGYSWSSYRCTLTREISKSLRNCVLFQALIPRKVGEGKASSTLGDGNGDTMRRTRRRFGQRDSRDEEGKNGKDKGVEKVHMANWKRSSKTQRESGMGL